MSSDDAHRGGSLEELAAEGTKIPNDAGIQNTIPSVPRPDQMTEDPGFTKGNVGAGDIQGAADNATDIPRRNKDIGATSEVITGTGGMLSLNENARFVGLER